MTEPNVSEEELPKVLVLRLSSHRAILLNMLVAIGCSTARGDLKAAYLLGRHVNMFARLQPEEQRALIESISLLVEQIPDSFLEAHGMTRFSSNEIRHMTKE